jgi:benzoate 4-monooxygenase
MLTFIFLPVVLITFFLSSFVWPVFTYFRDAKRLRQYPGPSFAPITNLWMMVHHYTGRRTRSVHAAHQQYGQIVRLGPNHLSFTSPDAIRDIYGHGTAAFKDKFYDAISGVHRQLLDTIDKQEHGIKRKRFAAAFAQKSVEEKEHNVRADIEELVHQWDALCSKPPALGQETFPTHELLDARRWFNLLMLDLAADFSFGHKLGFVKAGDDLTTCETIRGHKYTARPESCTNPNLQVISTIGFGAPALLKPYLKLFSLSGHRGVKDGQTITDFVTHLVRQRLAAEGAGEKRGDFFEALNFTRDGEPIAMEFGELVAECSLLVVAGSETTTCALQNIFHYLIRNPRCMEKLYEEVSTAFDDEDELVPAYDKVKLLPYLRAVIDETLRHRPSLSLALPRRTPPEGMSIASTWVPGETTVSVPTWSVHHDPALFEKPFEFIPERWLGESGSNLQKYFIPFSTGARACVGRNMAYLELSLIVATMVYRYHFRLSSPEWEPTIYETMVIKSGPMPVKIWRREHGKGQ